MAKKWATKVPFSPSWLISTCQQHSYRWKGSYTDHLETFDKKGVKRQHTTVGCQVWVTGSGEEGILQYFPIWLQEMVTNSTVISHLLTVLLTTVISVMLGYRLSSNFTTPYLPLLPLWSNDSQCGRISHLVSGRSYPINYTVSLKLSSDAINYYELAKTSVWFFSVK